MSQYRGKRVPDYNVDGTDAIDQDQERWMRERDRELLEAENSVSKGHGEEKRRRGYIYKVPTHQSTPPEIETSKRGDGESGQVSTDIDRCNSVVTAAQGLIFSLRNELNTRLRELGASGRSEWGGVVSVDDVLLIIEVYLESKGTETTINTLVEWSRDCLHEPLDQP